MSQETTELKAVVTVETRAEAQIDRLEKKIKSLAGAANQTFAAPLDTATKQAQLVSQAFEKHRGDMQDFGRAQRDWANSIFRQGKMTSTLYDELEKKARGMITKQGELRKGVDATQYVRAVRTLNAYAYVWHRHHDTYVRNLRQQSALQAQIEDKRLYLAQRANQAFERGEKRRADSQAALDRQRSRAFMAAERDKEVARRALERQRSRAFIAQIRAEEAAGRKAEADRIRGELRAQRESEKIRRQDERAKLKVASEQESARRSLERQRSRAYIAEIREQERLGRKAEADKIRDQLRQQRMQESSRRGLERQRSQAYLRELREQAAAEAKNARYIQQLKNNSWIMQMRQDEQTRRNADRNARATLRQFGVDGKQSLRGLGTIGGAIGSAVNRTGVIAMYGGAAAGAASAAAQRGLRSRMSVESAETELRMFGGELARPGTPAKPMSAADVAAIRSGWLDNASIDSGVSAATGLGVLTEVIKAGIDPAKQKEMTELVLGASAGMDMNTRETTRVLGRVSTNMNGIDATRMKQIMTSMAIASAQTAADPDEIVSGMDRGMGAISLGMSPEDLAAWVAVGRSTGIQAAKTGNFISTLLQKGVGAKNLRGQALQDMNTAAHMLGQGNARGMSRRAAADPNAWMEEVFEKVENMSVEKRSKLSSLMGGQEWDDEILQMKQGLAKLKETRDAIKDERNKNFLEDNKDLKNNSLRGLWSRMRARFGLLWETFGDGFTNTFEEVSRWFIISGRAVNLGGLRTIGASFMTGLVNGLGFDNYTAMLDKYFSGGKFDWGEINRKVEGFAKGFGKGMVAVYETVTKMLGMIPGTDKMDAEGVGEMTAKLVGFALGVQAGKPAWDLLGIVKDGLVALAGGIIFLNGTLGLLGIGGIKGLGGKALGALGARTFAGAAGAVGSVAIGEALGTVGVGASLAAIATGGILIAGLAAGVAAIAVTVMNWDAISNWFAKTFKTDKLPVDDKDPGEIKPYMDDREQAEGSGAGYWMNRFLDWMRSTPDAPAQRRQMSYSDESNDFRSLLHHASFEAAGLGDLKRSVDKMGARFELASITGPRIAAGSSAMLGGTGTGGGSGSSSYGLPSYSIPESDPAQRYGKRFFSVPDSMFGGGSYGGGSTAPRGNAAKNFAGLAPKITADLQKDFGLTKEDAAAILGNLGHESAGMTAFQEGNPRGGRGGWGWAQWTGPRRRAFERYVQERGLDPKSYEANYGFLKHELSGQYSKSLDAVRGARGLENKTVAFEKSYEGAAADAKHYDRRIGYARQAMGLGSGNQVASIDPNGVAIPGLGSGMGQYEGLRLKSAEAVAGGASALGVTDLARQAQENLPGGVARFSAFNDAFHHRVNPRSLHTRGLAFDTSLNDPTQHAAAAEAMRAKLRAAGLDESAFKVIDEYAKLSGHGTGGHIHTQFNSKEAAQKYHDYVEGLKDKAKTVIAGKEADNQAAKAQNDDLVVKSTKVAGWTKDITGDGKWRNDATGQEADEKKADALEKDHQAAFGKKRFKGGLVDLTPFGRAYSAAKAAKAVAAAKAALGDGAAKGPEAKKSLEDFGFTGTPFGASPETIAKAKAAANGGGAAAAAGGAPAAAAERLIKNVPAPAVGGGQGGGGGGNAPQIHVTQNINGWEKSPKEIADMSQKHITEAWNHRGHDLEPELT